VVWLTGPLGAGKTTLARALVRGRGVRDEATSPTYALVHHYEGPRGAVYHLDCYRLRTGDDAADLDWATLAAGDLLLIEWPERAGPWAPAATHRVMLEHAGDDSRRLAVS
jgi:tRNA threonylcarbamoyladenosine biosynthesis protein TsaE